jgi:hypothetical protein
MVALRKVDFETGDFSQNIQNVTGMSTITKGLKGSYAALLRSPPTSSLMFWSWDVVHDYPEMYIDFLVQVQQGFVVPEGGFWQLLWEENAPHPIGGNEHFGLMFKTARGVTNNIFLQFYSNYDIRQYDLPFEWGIAPEGEGSDRAAELYTGVEMPTGQPVHFEIYVKTHMTDGIIRIKMNGTVIIDYHGRTQFDAPIDPDTGQPNNAIAYVLTNYCADSLPVHDIIFDDIYIGTEPLAPTPTPPIIPALFIGGALLYLLTRRG